MALFTIMAVYPIYWIIIQSFKTTQDYIMTSKFSFPAEWYVNNYPSAWKVGNFGVLILNSIFYASVTIAAVILLGLLAGFGFAKIKNRATPLLHGIFIIGILLTLQSIMVPLFIVINAVKLYDTRLGVLLPYIGISLPMAIYLSTEYIKSIPDPIIESARIDGARYLSIFSHIVFPMAAPVAITIAILNFTGTWNEFMLINILTSNDAIKSLPVGINKFSGARNTDFGRQFAGLVIGLMPMVIFYLIFRRQIIKGVAAGAVKG
jgi:raffinose/stachyose/melibiose transport system permease protein